MCVMFYSPQMLLYFLALLRPMYGHWWVWPGHGIGPAMYEDLRFEPLVLSGRLLTHILLLSQIELHQWCVCKWCVCKWCVDVNEASNPGVESEHEYEHWCFNNNNKKTF